ncbi:MAG: cation:proton antiporter [Halobacteria archaeon]
MTEILSIEMAVISIFIVGAGVGIVVSKYGDFPYTIALLLTGLAVSISSVEFDLKLSPAIIFFVFLPPLLFEGAANMDMGRLKRDFKPVIAMAVVGLILSVVALGAAGTAVFGFPALISLLFAAIILPTDPVSVLALFEEMGVPKRLSVLVEGESLFNDGVAIVLFSTFLSQIQTGGTTNLLSFDSVGLFIFQIAKNGLGGAFVGLLTGYFIYTVMTHFDEPLVEVVLTIVLAFGSFILAQSYLDVSGIIATVVAGLFIGNRGAERAMSPQSKVSIFTTWKTMAFLVNTSIFLLLGASTPISTLVDHGYLILAGAVLVLLARAFAVYPVIWFTNRKSENPIPMNYQHVLVWSGMHASVPIALALSLPFGMPFREQVKAMVFGVAAFSLVVQGLTMDRVLDRLDIVTRSDIEKLYEMLKGRRRAVDEALDSAEDLHRKGELPYIVYDEFLSKYEKEKRHLDKALSKLLEKHPDIRSEQFLNKEKQVLLKEKGAILDAARDGTIGEDVADDLLEEIDIKLDNVSAGRSTIGEDGFDEFWRKRLEEYDLDFEDGV